MILNNNQNNFSTFTGLFGVEGAKRVIKIRLKPGLNEILDQNIIDMLEENELFNRHISDQDFEIVQDARGYTPDQITVISMGDMKTGDAISVIKSVAKIDDLIRFRSQEKEGKERKLVLKALEHQAQYIAKEQQNESKTQKVLEAWEAAPPPGNEYETDANPDIPDQE